MGVQWVLYGVLQWVFPILLVLDVPEMGHYYLYQEGHNVITQAGELESEREEKIQTRRSRRGTHSLYTPNIILIGPPAICEICSKTFTFIIFF